MQIVPSLNGPASLSMDSLKVANAPLIVDFNSFREDCVCSFAQRHDLTIGGSGSLGTRLVLQKTDRFQPEEYDLQVTPAGITIAAAHEAGVVWALATISQLLDVQGRLRCCQIHDQPRYAHRGLSLDCARHFFPIQVIRRIIEQMSRVKMNKLHWHLTDDQGWRIESHNFPKLHQQHGNEYYTQAEIVDLVAYAQQRGVEIIPEIDMPGHITALLAAYPEYSCTGQAVQLAQRGGIHPVVLCAGHERTYEMVERLLDELCQLFSAATFHIGGDEAPKKAWRQCPVCQQKIIDHGLKDEIELQGYFSNRLIKILADRGKQVICWNDALEAANIDPNAAVQFWSVQYTESFEAFIAKGGQFIFSDMFCFYLDYPHSMTSLRRLYEAPLMIGETDYTESQSLRGLEVCIWSEHLREPEQLEEKLFPRMYAAADKMWSTKSDYEDFHGRLKNFVHHHHPAQISCTPEERWNPQGDARRNETLAYVAKMNAEMSPEMRQEIEAFFVPNEQFRRKYATSFFEPADLSLLMQSGG